MTREEAIEILNRDDNEMRKGWFCINDFKAIEVLKKADVVERSKVNAAIEKIDNLIGYKEGLDTMNVGDDIMISWLITLEILKNI